MAARSENWGFVIGYWLIGYWLLENGCKHEKTVIYTEGSKLTNNQLTNN